MGRPRHKRHQGGRVIAELKPEEDKDYIVEKRTYGGFYETCLDPLLCSLHKGEGVKTVIRRLTHKHVHTPHIRRCFFRGYQIVIAKDGVEAFTVEDH